ncbi:hypothetical protein [Faecalibacillus faecis]|uniref:hypothetical protein n=1 Tax=Faecalibacillus faecis TaxID=1982628 RepID=UPI0022E4392A|nr:hypothetical protein [Faecalibacillus faecis]
MNYVYPTKNAFIVPLGTTLKRKQEPLEIKEQRSLLRECLDKKLSINGKKVYNTKPSRYK